MGKYTAARDLDLTVDTRWYVMASRTEAVFYREGKDKKPRFLSRLSNPTGAKSETELDSDRPGRVASSASGTRIRHSLDRRTKKHEESAKRFARLIARDLASARTEQLFGHLVLVAEPHFLGLLRKSLPASLRKVVRHEIAREIAEGSTAKVAELREHIRELG